MRFSDFVGNSPFIGGFAFYGISSYICGTKLLIIKFYTNISLIKHLSATGKLSHYCYFVKLKYHFSNSLYYNYKLGRLAKIHGHANKTIHKQIQFFLDAGWCWMDGAHLKFRSLTDIIQIEKLEAQSFTKININIENVKAVKLKLQQLLFEDNLRKQEYVMRMKDNLHNPKNLQAHKSAIRWNRKQANSGERSSNLTISLKKMSHLFNCSITTANRIKQNFRSRGWYEFFRQFSILTIGVTRDLFNKGIAPYYRSAFLIKGTVYQSEPSKVVRLVKGLI